jgi:hypothetical protein
MHMTPDVVITGIILVTTSMLTLFIRLCELNREDRRELDRAEAAYEARHDRTAPRLPPDPFDWMATMAILDQERERLPASTGELRALYQRPYGGLSETGELRALALAGDAETIAMINEAWKAENLTEGESA